jgi:hypothetical protein
MYYRTKSKNYRRFRFFQGKNGYSGFSASLKGWMPDLSGRPMLWIKAGLTGTVEKADDGTAGIFPYGQNFL